MGGEIVNDYFGPLHGFCGWFGLLGQDVAEWREECRVDSSAYVKESAIDTLDVFFFFIVKDRGVIWSRGVLCFSLY